MARVLVVDDESLLRRLLERVLRDGGYDVVSARHGAEALSIMAEKRVDVVVTDFMMPRMSGVELALAIHEKLGDSAPPCVLISGTIDLVLPSQRAHFVAVLGKPFTPAQLRDAVARALRAARHAARNKRSGARLKAAADALADDAAAGVEDDEAKTGES